MEGVWLEYLDTRKDLECVITEERQLLEKLAYSQHMDSDGNRLGVEADLQVSSLLTNETHLNRTPFISKCTLYTTRPLVPILTFPV